MTTVEADFIAPKNAASILLDTTANATITPFQQKFTSPVMYNGTAVATITAVLTTHQGINYLSVPTFSFTTLVASTATCALLTGHFVPINTSKFLNLVVNSNGAQQWGSVQIDTTGTLTFYPDTAGSNWTSQSTNSVFGRVIKYKSQ
jgi:hypothetical protein